MGVPITPQQKRAVRSLLRAGQMNLSQIARQTGCNRKTVRRVRDGRKVRRKRKTPAEPRYAKVEPYECPQCSARAGYPVMVYYRPCVACEAREKAAAGALRARRLANTAGGGSAGALQSPPVARRVRVRTETQSPP